MHIVKAVEALGRDMGIPELALDDKGCLTLNVGEDSSLFFERNKDDLAVCFARRCRLGIEDALVKGFSLCHHKADPRYNLKVGLFRKDVIVCISRLESHHIKAGMLNGAVSYLFESMEKIL